jgi:hypothetical protein
VAPATKGGNVSEQYINLKALRWAREQDLPKTEKLVLVEYAIPANDKGYSYPSIENIASTWSMDRETVRRAREVLLVRRKLFRTKKTVGETGRVKVFRLPKPAYENGGQCRPFEKKVIDGKSGDKRRINGGQSTMNKEEGIKNNSGKKAEDNSLSSLGNGPLAGPLRSVFSSLSSRKEERQEPTWLYEIRGMYPGTTVDKDLKQIEEWARKKKKEFTRDLALNALRRNPPKKPGQRAGYLYHGKFIGNKEANALALKNPELLLNAKRAIKYADGKIDFV